VERGAPVLPEALLRRADAGRGLIVGLERLADPANVGSVFRNAQAFGADAVLLAPGGAEPLLRKAVRVSMAATLEVPFARVHDWPFGLEKLRAEGYRILACVADRGAPPLERFDPDVSRIVLLFGNEGHGLDAATIAAADAALTIPMADGADSVNVATASGIVLHHFARTRSAS
jgi:tRNA G18 (ribose-2'-O)-methylase SpoU